MQRVRLDTLLGRAPAADPYLYLVAGPTEAARMLREGLLPDPETVARLLARADLSRALVALEEEGDGIAGITVLRLRRAALPDRA